MSIKIEVNPGTLSDEQRQAVTQFIMTYPKGAPVTHREKIEFANTEKASAAVDALATKVNETISPEAAFGHLRIQDVQAEQKAANASLSAQVAAQPTGAELDSAGLPWDARIHAESKNKIADGTWRRKRILDAALLAHVEAELRQVMGALVVLPPAIPNATITNLPHNATIVPPPPPATETNVMPPIPASLVRAPTPPAPPPATAASPTAVTYVALIGKVSAAMNAKKITPADTIAICQKHGLPGLPMLSNRPDLLPQVAAEIEAFIASQP